MTCPFVSPSQVPPSTTHECQAPCPCGSSGHRLCVVLKVHPHSPSPLLLPSGSCPPLQTRHFIPASYHSLAVFSHSWVSSGFKCCLFTLLSLALPLLGLPLPSPVHPPELGKTLPSWPGQAPQHAALHHIFCFSSMSPAKQLNPKVMCSVCPLILMLWHMCQVPGTGLGWPVSMSFTLNPASQNPAPAPPSLIAPSGPLSLT